MLLDLALDLAHALDPVAFVQDRLKFEPDPWQARLLRSCAPWILLNCCRQSGKSTTTAAVALHTAIYDPGLILLVSPSLRQSKELFAKVTGFLKDLEPAEVLEEDNKSSCTLANSARVVSLPGDPDTLRGYSAPKLIIKDEASYVSDAMQAALDPMLAVSKGRLIEMSSPNGKRGHFYENWQGGIDVERIKIIGRECPRIGAEFLEKMRQKLGPMLFSQEFEGEFIDAEELGFFIRDDRIGAGERFREVPMTFPPSIFQVGHLERVPLGTPYPGIVAHVGRLLDKLPAGTELVIDLTGVGRPVFDMFVYSGISPLGVLITAGASETRDGPICGVPKLTLVSRLQALLHEGRLKILRELAEAETLVRELQDFRVEFTAAGHLTFNARTGKHDDLVLALAIAVWRAYGGGMASYGVWELTRRQAMGSRANEPRYFVGVDLGQSRDPTAIAVVRRVDPVS